ncbi:DUF6183 family protein [Nocardiopsis alborubida]|uniref:Uncharacterized protein n=1 Tax=Nocardiopsis alborubida TaxID=146802 RepID=A0A7X6MF20_9ACTN|nr:DUF6183 family protein [Nocardiopsis alborubida]NKZ00033.1 hypothetical protein [Nocardiopsis alborubida]
MSDRIQEIVADLPRMKSVTKVWAEAERSLAEGDAAFAADLGIALAKRYGSLTAQTWQYRSVLPHLLRLLITSPGEGDTGHALRLAASVTSLDRRWARYTASLLAASRAPEDLAALFTGGSPHAGAPEGLRACLVHEMVLAGVAVGEVPAVARWARSPHWQYHPLRWLPLSLTDLERAALAEDLPGGGSRSVLRRHQGGVPTSSGTAPRVFPATETTAETAVPISAAVANWAEESNGRVEARTYDLDAPLTADTLKDALMALGLDCLKGPGTRARLSLSPFRPDLVWRLLFIAASTGGAYNTGEHGAYGRLAAWRSLAALSYADHDSMPAEVEQRASECFWYSFGGSTDWFDQVMWDIGLVAVAPGRRRLAVLAATDTD